MALRLTKKWICFWTCVSLLGILAFSAVYSLRTNTIVGTAQTPADLQENSWFSFLRKRIPANSRDIHYLIYTYNERYYVSWNSSYADFLKWTQAIQRVADKKRQNQSLAVTQQQAQLVTINGDGPMFLDHSNGQIIDKIVHYGFLIRHVGTPDFRHWSAAYDTTENRVYLTILR